MGEYEQLGMQSLENFETVAMNLFRDQGAFRSFVGTICASGGGDTAEDIMGGLNKTFSCLLWREEASKVNNKVVTFW